VQVLAHLHIWNECTDRRVLSCTYSCCGCLSRETSGTVDLYRYARSWFIWWRWFDRLSDRSFSYNKFSYRRETRATLCISIEILFDCCTNNAIRSRDSLRSTLSNCHVLLHYLLSFVHASFNYHTASMGWRLPYQSTTNRVDVNWTVTVIIRFRPASELNVDDTAYASADHRTWRTDTYFRR